jgi:two-component system, LytTR family, sensor kinase
LRDHCPEHENFTRESGDASRPEVHRGDDLSSDESFGRVVPCELCTRVLLPDFWTEIDDQLDRRLARLGKWSSIKDGPNAHIDREEVIGGGHLRKDIRVVAIAGIWLVVAALFATQNFIGSHYASRPLTWEHAFGTAFVAWTLRAIGGVVAYWLATRVPFRQGQLVRALVVHAPASGVLAVVEQAVYSALLTSVPWFAGVMPSPVETHMNIVVYWAVVGIAHGARYYAESRREALTSSRLQTQLASARLDLLRSQLQPHFLFNTLNDVAELIHEDPERADAMLTNLSELLRTTLRSSAERDVTLREELDFLARYLEIARMRFQDRLTIRVDTPDALMDARVPSLILQPVVENAIRHGVARRNGDGTVVISANQVGNRLRLEVSDNGPGIQGGHTGIGLTNTRERLREQFGNNFALDLSPSSSSSSGTTAVIELPLSRLAPVRQAVEALV